jgi:hypothetical protein
MEPSSSQHAGVPNAAAFATPNPENLEKILYHKRPQLSFRCGVFCVSNAITSITLGARMFVGQMSRLKHPRGGRKITDREMLALNPLPVRRK